MHAQLVRRDASLGDEGAYISFRLSALVLPK